MNIEDVKQKLEKLASNKCWGDRMANENDLLVVDLAGSNVDDAFQGGIETGQTWLAQDVLGWLKELEN